MGADFARLGEVIRKLFNIVLSVHRQRVYANFGVCSYYGVRETLDMADRQTDKRTWLIKNKYTLEGLTCLLRPVKYILAKLIRLFYENANLIKFIIAILKSMLN